MTMTAKLDRAASARLVRTSDHAPIVLCALRLDHPDASALARAGALARQTGSSLRVLAVAPIAMPMVPLFPSQYVASAMSAIVTHRQALDSLGEFAHRTLGEPLPDSAIVLEMGSFVDALEQCAAELDAALIVVDPEAVSGSQLHASCRRMGRPILAAREPRPDATIVAATDLETPDAPVLQWARALGECTDARVFAAHVVEPPLPASSVDPTTIGHDELELVRRVRLERATAFAAPDASLAISRDDDAARGLLSVSRALDADLVIVGARQSSALLSLFRSHVPARVVDRALRSVLVIPLDCPEARSRLF